MKPKIDIGRCKDLSRKRFGRLTVKKPLSKRDGKVFWLCRCRCGRLTVVNGANLTSGKTRSCGCLQIEVLDDIIQKTRKRQDRTDTQLRRLEQ
ncbi:conserved hypothetical protein [Desulfosarcina cetonica]|nr:conserved hypothetical protein [Desulfosarcina cetonica]